LEWLTVSGHPVDSQVTYTRNHRPINRPVQEIALSWSSSRSLSVAAQSPPFGAMQWWDSKPRPQFLCQMHCYQTMQIHLQLEIM